MNVLVMIQTLWQGGGTETHVMTLAHGLQQMGHRVVLYTSGGPWVPDVRRSGLPVQVDPTLLQAGEPGVRHLIHFLRLHSCDIIHAHDGTSLDRASAAIRTMVKQPAIVFTVHGPYVRPRHIRHSARVAGAVIAVSPPIRRRIVRACGVSPRMVHTIQNGIRTDVYSPLPDAPLRRELGIPDSAFVVGYAGRFTFDKITLGKRISRILEQFAARRQDIHVVIAGRNSLETIAGAARVHVLGHVSNMGNMYRSCDVMIGTARVAAESIACARPTLIIGKSGYHGLVTMQNLSRMLVTNFGDHGPPARPWPDKRLTKDLAYVRRRMESVKLETRRVRARALEPISARRMVHRIAQVYEAVQ